MTTHRPWQIATIAGGALNFEATDAIDKVRSDGFFFLRHPDNFDMRAGDLFAQNFYLPKSHHDCVDNPYRGFNSWTSDRLTEHEGYFCRHDDQTEQFFLEHRFWRDVYPPDLVVQATAMQALALTVLEGILEHLDLPKPLWKQATGSCLSGEGVYHLTFNHYRPEVPARGLNVHKDSGWITLLRSLEPGLEVLRGGTWVPIAPMPDYFIVNFGCAMEILTRSCRTPVSAVPHRVAQQRKTRPNQPDRFSYALFVDSSLDESICPGLFRYDPNAGLLLEKSFKAFLDDILRQTYQRDTKGLYE